MTMGSPHEKITLEFHHADLGRMIGLVEPSDIVQFRAIPYATLPRRFEQSVVNDSLPESDRDFTKHGFACPQTFPDRVSDGGRFRGDIVPHPSDEYKCFILQLNVPKRYLESDEALPKIPVLVYIHGGGFVLGNIDEQHSTALMAEQSVRDSQPIITASIQYRLGALGYLSTPESGNQNLALNDQRNALIWIQRFIHGFGGDKNRVTVFGESAGSMSICAHMLSAPPSSGPLFRRAILMSGIIGPTTAPISKKEAVVQYDRFLERCGIKESGHAALRDLQNLDIQKIVDASNAENETGSMWLTVRDDQWYGLNSESIRWSDIPKLMGECHWVDDIIVGTTRFEGTTFMDRITDMKPDAFLCSLEQQLGPESAKMIAEAYDITSDQDQNLFITHALQWLGDAIFDGPTHMLAQYLSTKTDLTMYRYIFDVRNPFPNNPFYQQPHHWVDIYFVFKTFQFRYPNKRLKNLSTRHAQLWVDFANGKNPWNKYTYTGKGNETIMVANEREGWVERTVALDEEITELSWRRCERLIESWEPVRGKRFSPLAIEALNGKKLT